MQITFAIDRFIEKRSKIRWNKHNKDVLLFVTDKYIEIENIEGRLRKAFYAQLIYPEKDKVVPMTIPITHFEYERLSVHDKVKVQYINNKGMSDYYPIIEIHWIYFFYGFFDI